VEAVEDHLMHHLQIRVMVEDLVVLARLHLRQTLEETLVLYFQLEVQEEQGVRYYPPIEVQALAIQEAQ
jgi:hypothetical protein